MLIYDRAIVSQIFFFLSQVCVFFLYSETWFVSFFYYWLYPKVKKRERNEDVGVYCFLCLISADCLRYYLFVVCHSAFIRTPLINFFLPSRNLEVTGIDFGAACTWNIKKCVCMCVCMRAVRNNQLEWDIESDNRADMPMHNKTYQFSPSTNLLCVFRFQNDLPSSKVREFNKLLQKIL